MIAFLSISLSTAIASLALPLSILIANKLGILDKPNQAHKSHVKPVPYLGGMAILVSSFVGYFLTSRIINFPNSGEFLLLALVASVSISMIGFFDDLKPRGAVFRLVAQTIIVLAGCASLSYSERLRINLFENNFYNFLILSFFMLSVCNFVNMFDNHDGSASGVSFWILTYIAILATLNSQTFVQSLALSICSSTLIFVFWNFPPAKIYLGDAGSTFLGFAIAFLMVQLDFRELSSFESCVGLVIALGMLELDFCVAVISRLRRGLSPMQGDQAHTAHRLKRLGLRKWQVTLLIWLITIWFIFLSSIVLIFDSIPNNPAIILAAVSFFGLLTFFLKQSDV